MANSSPTTRRVQIVNGVLYYSPNSPVDAPLNLDKFPIDIDNPFKPGSGHRPVVHYHDFIHPRPWSRTFGWISFIPAVPWDWSSCALVGVLAHHPPILHFANETGNVHGYRLPVPNLWEDLEDNVYAAVVALKNAYHTPCVLPFLPKALGFRNMHSEEHWLKGCIGRSRAWFQVWFGALSYLLACAVYPTEDPRCFSELPEVGFKAALRTAGLPEAWTDDLLVSPIAQYSIQNHRAGTIIDILNPVQGQPPLAWFSMFGIPVWYRWGETEEKLAKKSSSYDEYRPPHNLTAQYFSYLKPTPTAPLSSGTPQPASSSKGPIDEQPWVAFFKQREEEHILMIKKETPIQRQRRLDREKDPPTSSAPVFEWWPCSDGVVYERLPVPAKLRADTLSLYGGKQSRYDSFFNEWDCCDQFLEPGTPDSDSEWDGDDDYDYDIPPPIPSSNEAFLTRHTEPDPQPDPPSYADLDLPSDRFQQYADQQPTPSWSDFVSDVEEVFGGYYGFVMPVPGTEIPTQSNDHNSPKELFVRAVGNKKHLPADYLSTTHCTAATKFFDDISNQREPPTGMWDLKDDCIRPVRLTTRFQHFQRIPLQKCNHEADELVDSYFVFLSPNPTVRWKIAFTSALDVLTVCRLPLTFTEYDIVLFLGQRGVPFRVLYPRFSIFQMPIQPRLTHPIPTRPFNHIFTKADYDSYVVHRTMLLGQPHMHAALKRGGIVWRLAVGTLGLSKVSYPAVNWGATSIVLLDGANFSDNVLTRQELDIICGLYECVSPDGKRCALKSWWPLSRYYEKPECGENYSHWTHRRENWYRERLEAIEADDSKAQPLSYQQWKSQQHGPWLMRTFLDQVKKTSLELLNLDLK